MPAHARREAHARPVQDADYPPPGALNPGLRELIAQYGTWYEIYATTAGEYIAWPRCDTAAATTVTDTLAGLLAGITAGRAHHSPWPAS